MVRCFAAGSALLALAACSQPSPSSSGQAGAAPAQPVSQWLMVAHTDNQGGGVYVDPSLRKIDPATGFSDVTLKIIRGSAPALNAEGGGESLYRNEIVTYRFNCAARTYAFVKREAINAKGDVLDTTTPEINDAAYKDVAPGGVATVALSQACPPK